MFVSCCGAGSEAALTGLAAVHRLTSTGWALAARRISERYVALEEGARAAGRGLWRGQFITPWDWRAGLRLPQSGAE